MEVVLKHAVREFGAHGHVLCAEFQRVVFRVPQRRLVHPLARVREISHVADLQQRRPHHGRTDAYPKRGEPKRREYAPVQVTEHEEHGGWYAGVGADASMWAKTRGK